MFQHLNVWGKGWDKAEYSKYFSISLFLTIIGINGDDDFFVEQYYKLKAFNLLRFLRFGSCFGTHLMGVLFCCIWMVLSSLFIHFGLKFTNSPIRIPVCNIIIIISWVSNESAWSINDCIWVLDNTIVFLIFYLNV